MQSHRSILAVALCAWALAAGAAGGSGGDSDSSWPAAKAEDPALTTAKAAIAAGDYASAQLGLKLALAGDPNNADLHNLYAYALRKGPKPDLDLVFKHYREALRIDPGHRGANEYIGEAYLMIDNPAKAKEHLAALDKLCFFGCAEYAELKQAIAAYEARPK